MRHIGMLGTRWIAVSLAVRQCFGLKPAISLIRVDFSSHMLRSVLSPIHPILLQHPYSQPVQFSGGIFVDCSIHDIDLALWFFGEDSIVKSVCAVGITAVQPELRKHNDRDNAVGIVEFHNGKIAQLFCSRMMAAGQEDCTEVTGTEGKVTVNTQPMSNLVNIYEGTGIRREIPPDYYGRFREAFITEANEFTACCLDNKKVPMKLDGAVKAVKIGCALQESLITGVKIEFDEIGRRTTKSFAEKARL